MAITNFKYDADASMQAAQNFNTAAQSTTDMVTKLISDISNTMSSNTNRYGEELRAKWENEIRPNIEKNMRDAMSRTSETMQKDTTAKEDAISRARASLSK